MFFQVWLKYYIQSLPPEKNRTPQIPVFYEMLKRKSHFNALLHLTAASSVIWYGNHTAVQNLRLPFCSSQKQYTVHSTFPTLSKSCLKIESYSFRCRTWNPKTFFKGDVVFARHFMFCKLVVVSIEIVKQDLLLGLPRPGTPYLSRDHILMFYFTEVLLVLTIKKASVSFLVLENDKHFTIIKLFIIIIE